MNNVTHEQVARRIVQQCYPDIDMNHAFDLTRVASAAIAEATEAAAQLVDDWPDKVLDGEPALFCDGSRWTARHVSSAIRRNDHLKGQP